MRDSERRIGHADEAGIAGNERLTALAGAILLALIVISGVSGRPFAAGLHARLIGGLRARTQPARRRRADD